MSAPTDVFSQVSSSSQPNAYQTVNIFGNARAILGNVAHDGPTLLNAHEFEWKNTWKALYFEGMRTRKAQIDKRASSPEYVDWVWRTNFAEWLRSDASFFWITGRAGSGKSTLMKHIADSRRTRQHLQHQGGSWTVVHFFFDFRAGLSLANSLEGMLRSMLYQLIKRCPELTKEIDPIAHDGKLDLDLVSCLNYICGIADAADFRICAFIDGLDEFEGSGADLIGVISSLEDRAGFKMCLASRPYEIFKTNLSSYASLTVQDFNDESIKLYAQSQWQSARLGVQASLPHALGNRIREKAGGVFLWARLAIDELLQDLLRGKSTPELEEQLEEMPREVAEMYQRILDRIPSIMVREATLLLYLILWSTSRRIHVRYLYTILHACDRLPCMKSSQKVFPVLLDEDRDLTARLVNVLGDFVDVDVDIGSKDYSLENLNHSNEYHEKKPQELIPTIISDNSKLKIREEVETSVSFTHETLKTFLIDNSWLHRHLPAKVKTVPSERFWMHVYLEEVESAMTLVSSNESNQKLFDLVKQIYIYSWNRHWNEMKRLYDTSLAFLMEKQAWTPLLVLSMQQLFEEIERMAQRDGSLGTGESQRIGKILKSQIMHHHFIICHVQSCSSGFLNPGVRNQRDGYSAGGVHPSDPRLKQCIYSMPARLVDQVDTIGWDILFCICHNLPEPALQNLLADGLPDDKDAAQNLFDMFWEKMMFRGDCDRYMQLITHLIRAGARLKGRHLCSLLVQIGMIRGLPPGFLQEQPGDPDLHHSHDCPFSRVMADKWGFFGHWAYASGPQTGPHLSLYESFQYLLRSGEKADSRVSGEPLLNLLVGPGAYDQGFTSFMGPKVVIALRAGADPTMVGEHGNALQAVRALSTELRYKLIRLQNNDVDTSSLAYDDVDEIECVLEDIVAIEELFEGFFETGRLDEKKLEELEKPESCITIRSFRYVRPTIDMNPYHFLERL